MLSIPELRAACGRFLTAADLLAWEHASQQRCTELARAFQNKLVDPETLRAALASERLGASPPSARSGVAVIPLVGVLMPTSSLFSMLGFGTSVRDFTQQLTTAVIDPAIKAIVVIADSPGGSVRLIPEAADAMRRARNRKPVVVSVVGMCASAAYWISSCASVIEASPSASVGAIGVLRERVSIVKHLEQEGVEVTVVSAGRYKAEGHIATSITPAERKALQDSVNDAYRVFTADIGAGRQVDALDVRRGFGEGRLVDAPDAVRLGMIDRVATVDDTITRTLAAPAAVTAQLTARVTALCQRTVDIRRDDASAEIQEHRARIRAAVQGRPMR